MDKVEILEQIENLKLKYGDWAYDIPLPYEIWTNGNQNLPHTRLNRIVRIISDTVGKPLSKCRILDLGCLDGIFSIEFAKQGAETIGVEIREANIEKARFCKDVLRLDNLKFRQDDARNISVECYGQFDAILCSGLLYHLTAPDAIDLISKMFEMSKKLVVIDTSIALKPEVKYNKENKEYWGKIHQEHFRDDSQERKSKRLWSSWDNNESFWFTRPSLVNILGYAGFTSVYECFNPIHLGPERKHRCTFVALKGEKCEIINSPSVNTLDENWPENSLIYNPPKVNLIKLFFKKVVSRLKRILKYFGSILNMP